MYRILLFLLLITFSNNLYSQEYWCDKCQAYHSTTQSNIKTKEIVITLPDGTQRNIRNLPYTWPTWSWPGNLEQHLLRTHNVNTSGWNHSERVNLHNYAHNTAKISTTKNLRISCNIKAY
jgi:hypothetical protein